MLNGKYIVGEGLLSFDDISNGYLNQSYSIFIAIPVSLYKVAIDTTQDYNDFISKSILDLRGLSYSESEISDMLSLPKNVVSAFIRNNCCSDDLNGTINPEVAVIARSMLDGKLLERICRANNPIFKGEEEIQELSPSLVEFRETISSSRSSKAYVIAPSETGSLGITQSEIMDKMKRHDKPLVGSPVLIETIENRYIIVKLCLLGGQDGSTIFKVFSPFLSTAIDTHLSDTIAFLRQERKLPAALLKDIAIKEDNIRKMFKNKVVRLVNDSLAKEYDYNEIIKHPNLIPNLEKFYEDRLAKTDSLSTYYKHFANVEKTLNDIFREFVSLNVNGDVVDGFINILPASSPDDEYWAKLIFINQKYGANPTRRKGRGGYIEFVNRIGTSNQLMSTLESLVRNNDDVFESLFDFVFLTMVIAFVRRDETKMSKVYQGLVQMFSSHNRFFDELLMLKVKRDKHRHERKKKDQEYEKEQARRISDSVDRYIPSLVHILFSVGEGNGAGSFGKQFKNESLSSLIKESGKTNFGVFDENVREIDKIYMENRQDADIFSESHKLLEGIFEIISDIYFDKHDEIDVKDYTGDKQSDINYVNGLLQDAGSASGFLSLPRRKGVILKANNVETHIFQKATVCALLGAFAKDEQAIARVVFERMPNLVELYELIDEWRGHDNAVPEGHLIQYRDKYVELIRYASEANGLRYLR